MAEIPCELPCPFCAKDQDRADIAVRPDQHALARCQFVGIADVSPGVDNVALQADAMNMQPRTGCDDLRSGVIDKQRPMRTLKCVSAWNIGSDAISMTSGGSDDTRLEQIELSASIHLPLDEFELGDLAFCLAVRPLRGYRILDCRPVAHDAVGE